MSSSSAAQASDFDDANSDDSQSTKVASDVSDSKDARLDDIDASLQAQRDAPEELFPDRDYGGQVFWWLLAFRLLNAMLMRTMFQPDEYFQSLEPAWEIAFGSKSGAWITWEWRHQMRSTIPPFMFGGLYWLCARFADLVELSAPWRAELLIAAPKALQATIAAIGDYYTYKLGGIAYGDGHLAHWFALILTVANPFHFYCITRTFSNCTELSLNAAALYLWFTSAPEDPTSALLTESETEKTRTRDRTLSGSWISTKLEESTTKVKEFVVKQVRAYDLNKLRLCLGLAAVGCILRITNVLTWLALVSFEFLDYKTTWHRLFTVPHWKVDIKVPRIVPQLRELNHAHFVLVREAVLCGSTVLALSMMLDRHYYGHWTLPAIQFLYVNVAEGISSFYGTEDAFWYFTQGFPLLLGAFLPFALMQIYYYLVRAPDVEDDFPSIIKYEFSAITLFVPMIFSFIAHKEVRFIYPIIPILHTLAAGPAAEFCRPFFNNTIFERRDRKAILRLALAAGVVIINILVALVVSTLHSKGPSDVMEFLRHEHEALYLSQPPAITGLPTADTSMTVGFLMPCHSTPWRSHLVHPGIKAWALGCEPPLGMSPAQKAVYRDEADQFYDDPEAFLIRTLGRPKISKRGLFSWNQTKEGFGVHGDENAVAWDGKPGRKVWPEYLVFFQEKEELLGKMLAGSSYIQCWRGWNTWWHDDWRRRGDLIVWCHRDKPIEIKDMDGVMAQKLTKKGRKAIS